MRHFSRQPHGVGGPLTRIDPRIKLLSSLALLAMVTSCSGFLFPLVVAAASLGFCFSLGVRPRLLAVRFAEPFAIALVAVLLKMLFSGTEPLFSVSLAGLDISGQKDGLLAGLLIAARIAGAVSLVALLGFSTSFTDLMAALAWLRLPKGFIDVAMFAWRYLFVLLDDAQTVYSAQKNRLGYAGYRRGLRSFGTLAGVLVIKAFDSSQTITTAMVQRGYDGTMPLLKHKPLRSGEVLASLAMVVVMGIMWQGF